MIGALTLVPLATLGASADTPPDRVSVEARARIQEQVEVERHRIIYSDRPGRLWRADSPSQRFTAHFGPEDVVLVLRAQGKPAMKLGLRLTGWGAEHGLQPVHPAGAVSEGNHVEYRRGPLTEWYANTTMGLEQGFTIEVPPRDDIGELVLEMASDGDLTAILAGSENTISFQHDATNATLIYSGLAAWDAVGESLDARMEVGAGGTRLRIVLSVNGAAWPVTVGATFTQVAKLLPAPTLDSSKAFLGHNVAVDDGVMMVGLYNQEQGAGSGVVHVFQRDCGGADAWGHVAELVAGDVSRYDNFGRSISVNGNTAVFGGKDSAYVFQRAPGESYAWTQVAKIVPSNSAPEASFGQSVAISGDIAIISAPHDNENGPSSGSVYIFRRDHGGPDTWGQVAKITPTDGEVGEYFGFSVSINADTAVVGAPIDDDNGFASGSAYVFHRNYGGADAWGQVAKITSSDGATEDYFGQSVSIDDDIAVVGAAGDGESGPYSGSAYLFQRNHGGPNAWQQVTKISASDAAERSYFGTSVSINADTAVIGTSNDDEKGSAYVFQRDHGGPDHWGQTAKITSSEGVSGDGFGSSVAISGDDTAVGAPRTDDRFTQAGAAYVFQRDQGGTGVWGEVMSLLCPPVFGARENNFGWSVAICGDTAVVGAPGDGHNGNRSGSAYIFQRGQGGPGAWRLATKITTADGAEFHSFGEAVAISGDTAVVGAKQDDDNGPNSGAVYVFQRGQNGVDAWGQVAKITPADGAEDNLFGLSVAISGDTSIVGAFTEGYSGSTSGPGSAYIFRRDQNGHGAWGQVAKISAIDGADWDHFGESISISGDTAIVGAYGDDDNGSESGSAYIFQRDRDGPDAWGQVAKITASDSAAADHFGFSVSISADIAVIGTPNDDDNGSKSGSAYVFQRNYGGPGTWGQVAKITSSDGAADDYFGLSVSISADIAVIGTPNDDDNGSNSGSVYVFQRDHGWPHHWGQIAKITSSDGFEQDQFGKSVFISADTALAGAPSSDILGRNSGEVIVFSPYEYRSSPSAPRRVTPSPDP